jgi:hypothetical protein
MTGLRTELSGLRTLTAAAALRNGGRLPAAGVLPTAPAGPAVAGAPRYRRMAGRYGRLVAEQQICGRHVHAGISGQATAAAEFNDTLVITDFRQVRADDLVTESPERAWHRLPVGAGAHGRASTTGHVCRCASCGNRAAPLDAAGPGLARGHAIPRGEREPAPATEA